ncbi:MAG TPA: CGNR zinc finger domain-containing protein, partial [Thermomicrobiales bacterium]
ERLTSYRRLLAWARQTGALAPVQADRLTVAAAAQPDDANMALAETIAVREAIYHLFSALAAGRPLPDDALSTLNGALTEALGHLRLSASATGPTWEWVDGGERFTRPLWPVVRSAAELLTSADRVRVRECAGTGCGWLFLDTSRNGSRRWCDTRDCGNRERVRRHYARQKRSSC